MDYPKVQVTDITSERDQLVTTTAPKPVDLGGRHSLQAAEAEYLVSSLKRRSHASAGRVFLLKWEGSKIPRGAVVLGKTIAWTQNGCVSSDAGEMIGMYDRLVEFGGDSGNEQQMLVYMSSPPLV